MFKSIEKLLTTIISAGSNYYFISNRNDPIRQYCQTEFKDEWKRLSNNDPDFAQAQHDFIQGSHHNPAVRKIKQSTGIDVCDGSWSNGVQDAVWSTSVQHGSGGANTIVQRALTRTGKTASTVTDQELISAINEKIV